MDKEVIDTTWAWVPAVEAAAKSGIDWERQFCVPDFAQMLRSAWIHGYKQALLDSPILSAHVQPTGESK